ncbi:hypothetical protein EDD18DRAFT_1356832 [Armillaria luteobubalina]|uniref:Uncharacterized protein n=1 Tax=Armillaria luteobubalina TaxID=153913 RepID=A0AA39UQU3_9AGAR|nr:hypothetical protein EDD18DRAFT_1356832 [Armillaria luteobubalina]
MDQFYDKGEAMRTVDSLTDERVAKDKQHLAGIHKDKKALQSMHIVYKENAQVWRLAKGEQEMVFTITGAIVTMDLPPIIKETLGMRDKLKFLSQSIMLTGCGSDRFKQVVVNLKEMWDRGEREFRQGQLMEWAPAQVQGFNVIELSNRYFQRRTSASTQGDGICISRDMDPNGILRRLAGDRLEHMEDNEVKYFRGIAGEKKRYLETKPQAFRIGDIVEVQCSIVFVVCRGSDMKMKLILQALALVNCDHTMNTDKERKKGDEGRGFIGASKRMKRKVGFEYLDSEEEMGEERSVKHQQQANVEREDMHTDM